MVIFKEHSNEARAELYNRALRGTSNKLGCCLKKVAVFLNKLGPFFQQLPIYNIERRRTASPHGENHDERDAGKPFHQALVSFCSSSKKICIKVLPQLPADGGISLRFLIPNGATKKTLNELAHSAFLCGQISIRLR